MNSPLCISTPDSARLSTPPAGGVWAPISPAELIDKLTILEIKLERIPVSDLRRHVETEHACLAALFAEHIPNVQGLQDKISDLREVNRRLWDIETALRACEQKQAFEAHFIALARDVYLQNDRRHAIKREINTLLRSGLVEAKWYVGKSEI